MVQVSWEFWQLVVQLLSNQFILGLSCFTVHWVAISTKWYVQKPSKTMIG